jgi:exopolysaccharide production protein ExoY
MQGVGFGGQVKRVFDFVGAFIVLLLLLPLFTIVAATLKLTQPGPIFYKQPRVGYRGRYFKCLKFRTMVVDSEQVLKALLEHDPAARAEWQRSQKLVDDPRITRVGRWLRQSSIDELPQLVNVLRGEMSLVGPRPIVASEIVRYGDHIGLYLSARPGLTGAWQVNGRSNTCYDKRVELDANYASNWRLATDLKILLRTIWVVIKKKGSC